MGHDRHKPRSLALTGPEGGCHGGSGCLQGSPVMPRVRPGRDAPPCGRPGREDPAHEQQVRVLGARPGCAARLAPRYAKPPGSYDVSDALSLWSRNRDAGHDGDGTPRITDGRLTAKRQAAIRFRRAGRAPLIPSPGLPMPCAWRPGRLPA